MYCLRKRPKMVYSYFHGQHIYWGSNKIITCFVWMWWRDVLHFCLIKGFWYCRWYIIHICNTDGICLFRQRYLFIINKWSIWYIALCFKTNKWPRHWLHWLRLPNSHKFTIILKRPKQLVNINTHLLISTNHVVTIPCNAVTSRSHHCALQFKTHCLYIHGVL